MRASILAVLAALASLSCDPPTEQAVATPAPNGAQLDWSIAIHGGAGGMPRDAPEEDKLEALTRLEAALTLGRTILDEGGTSLDAVEQVIRALEDDPWFNAGKGAVFNHEGEHELDASIMDGATLSCGAVAGVRTVKNPISLARQVMERTRHVLLAAGGAEAFADEVGVDRVDQGYFYTQKRRDSLQRVIDSGASPWIKGTVGVVALDRQGNLAAGTSTGGLTNKMFGRVGDSPIIGAGTYADNRTVAVSGTGVGEEFIRHSVAYAISALMAHGGLSVQEAAERLIHDTLDAGVGGVIAVDHDGNVAMVYNTTAMYRGAAASDGSFDVSIWD